MEWKKSNVSSSELEKQQEAYIKEALEMAKRSVAGELDKAAAEKAAAEKAATEKAAAEKSAAEKAAAEKALAEKAAAEKAAAEKAAAEKALAEKAAEKAAAEKAAAEKALAEKAAAEKAAAEKAAAEKAAAEKAAAEKEEEELTKFSEETDNDEVGECKKENTCCEQSGDIIDIAELKKHREQQTAQSGCNNAAHKSPNPSGLNGYVNEHNSKAPCNCPNCQRKRAQR